MRQPTSKGRKMLLYSIEWWDVELSLCLCQGRTDTSLPNDLVCGSERKGKRRKHWKSGAVIVSQKGFQENLVRKTNKQTSSFKKVTGARPWRLRQDHYWKFKVSFHYVGRASEERRTVKSIRSGKCCQITWLQGHTAANGLSKDEAF